MPLLPNGSLLENRYQIKEMLGKGGAAEVYRAHDGRLDRMVAIRILTIQTSEAQIRFVTEAKRLANLRHPHIVEIYDILQYNNQYPYMVIEYIDGESLADEMNKRKHPYSFSEMFSLIEPIAEALQYAHDHNLLHRDITPGNILLRSDRKPFLADFGLVEEFDPTKTSMLVSAEGTPGYAPAEMHHQRGMPKDTGKANPQSDLYSLGAVIYHMITGDVPVLGITKDRTSSLAYSPLVSPVMFKALSLDYHDRYQSVRDFMHELKIAIDGEELGIGMQASPKSGMQSPLTISVPLVSKIITPDDLDRAITQEENPYVSSSQKWGGSPYFIDRKGRISFMSPPLHERVYRIAVSRGMSKDGENRVLAGSSTFRDFAFQTYLRLTGSGTFYVSFRGDVGKSKANAYSVRIVSECDTSSYSISITHADLKDHSYLECGTLHNFPHRPFLLGIVVQRYHIDVYVDLVCVGSRDVHLFDEGSIFFNAFSSRRWERFQVEAGNIKIWKKQ